ncbi:MAG: gliding motility-associated C-terminal domain-containing protein [Bacteroidales bacterium]|nr:gliding motility-associated C-terminal domain-containing protein [Bacteroidales bacterium]
MKKQFLGMLILLCCVQLTFAQSGSSNAVRLNSGVEVLNTIFWNNPNFAPTSPGVLLKHSASDSLTVVTNNNVHLLISPFADTGRYQINTSSPAHDAGNDAHLTGVDTLDLDYNSRISCTQVDIGAYEFQLTQTRIINQPQNLRLCEGTPGQLTVTAVGDVLTYQWQRLGLTDWENLPGNPLHNFLIFSGSSSENGIYRVIVEGVCCNDTSTVAEVIFDIHPASALVVMNDTTIVSGESVELVVISSVGTVTWYEDDLQIVVLDPFIQNITETRQYIAVSRNGVCPDSATAEVWIFVNGTRCLIKTGPDTTICHGDSYRLILDSALVDYTWINLNTGATIPHFAVVRPDTTTRFVAFGQNLMGDQCSDTLTIFVHKVALEVMDDVAVCYWNNNVLLWSIPPVAEWWGDHGGLLGVGDINITVPSNQTTTVTAKYNDGTCSVERVVSIFSNPPTINILVPDTTVCIGSSIQLSTNVDPHVVVWRERLFPDDPPGSGPIIPHNPSTPGPIVTPPAPGIYVYEAWDYDVLCGDVHAEVTITVQANPEFTILSPSDVCLGMSTVLQSSPSATFWTLSDSTTRVFNPVTILMDNTYIGWYDDGVCVVTASIDITAVPAPTLTVRPDTTIILGSIVQLWSVPDTVHWTMLPNTYLGQGTQFVNPSDTAVYVAELYHVCGIFTDTVRINVITETIPIDDFNVIVEYGIGCFDGTGWAIVVIDGATTYPFTFLWFDDGSTDSVRTSLPVGDYAVLVKDNIGTEVFKNFTLALSPIEIERRVVQSSNATCNDGVISTTVTGGVPPYSYLWSDDLYGMYNQPSRHDLAPGDYTLTVVDAKGCQQTFDTTLICTYRYVLPTMYISPNDDGYNDYLIIQYIERFPINRVVILNSFGEQIRAFKNYDNVNVVWDGKNSRGQSLPDGVYYYIIEAEGLDPMAGWVLMGASKR